MKNLGRAALLALCAALAACSTSGAIPPQPNAAAPASRAAAPAQGDVVATVPLWRELGAKDAGPAPGRTSLALAITLQYRDQAGLDALVAGQADPRSSSYHHWLSNEQFARRFAPAPEQYQRLLRSLRSAGFEVDATYANRTVVDASATVSTLERYFKTSIHRVEQARGGVAYVNVRPAFAPSDLSGAIRSVDGLNTMVVAQTYHRTLAPDAARPLGLSVSNASLFGPISSVTNARGYSPLAFTAAYDLPAMHATTTALNGAGRASGIVIDADFAESDLRQFLAYFKIDRTGPATRRVLVHGGPPAGDGSNDSIEAALDAETLVGIAPGTALSVYEISKLDNALITDAFNTAVSDNAVDSVNASFGGCELYVGQRTVQAWNAIAEQGAAKGITFHAATGDSGGSLCANAPASLPYAVAVGGTALIVGNGGAWAGEGAWSGGGGGISSVFAQPSWQAGVTGTVSRGRNEPDVAFDADPETGTAFYFTGTWNTQYNPLGGTSLASPMYGAIVAQIDQVKGGRAGLDTTGLYGFFTANGYAAGPTAYFHDITAGNDGAFDAVTGYDLATGIGSVDAWNVANQF